jgi:hypothetical protein
MGKAAFDELDEDPDAEPEPDDVEPDDEVELDGDVVLPPPPPLQPTASALTIDVTMAKRLIRCTPCLRIRD